MYIYIIHDYLYFMVLDERHYRGMEKKSFILQYFIMSIYLMGGH